MPDRWPTAGDLMTASPVTVPHEAPLSQALGLMRTRGIHELPVLRRRNLVGMITFESIARRTNLPLSTKVVHLMSLPPLVTELTSFGELSERLLAAGLRGAPVVGRRGELVGVVSRTDLVRALVGVSSLAQRRVEEVQSPLGPPIRENETISNLLGFIRQLEEHPLPVIDRKGKLVGAVGVADLGRVLWRPVSSGKRDAEKSGRALDVVVATIMRSPPVTVVASATVGEAAQRMTDERISSVFVVEGDRPTAIVSQADLLGFALARSSVGGRRGVQDVYVQIHGLRGSGDPELLSEIDRLVAKGLRHIGHHVRPTMLSLNINPHSTHRSGDATVQARLQTDRAIFYASHTGWNFLAGISALMDELAEQTRRARKDRRPRRGGSRLAPSDEEPTSDSDLEAKIRVATGRID